MSSLLVFVLIFVVLYVDMSVLTLKGVIIMKVQIKGLVTVAALAFVACSLKVVGMEQPVMSNIEQGDRKAIEQILGENLLQLLHEDRATSVEILGPQVDIKEDRKVIVEPVHDYATRESNGRLGDSFILPFADARPVTLNFKFSGGATYYLTLQANEILDLGRIYVFPALSRAILSYNHKDARYLKLYEYPKVDKTN